MTQVEIKGLSLTIKLGEVHTIMESNESITKNASSDLDAFFVG